MIRRHTATTHTGYCNELQPSVWKRVPARISLELIDKPVDKWSKSARWGLNATSKHWGLNETNNNCERGESGGWAVEHEMICRARCRKCARCRFYSFSYEASRLLPRCSWYHACNLSALSTKAPGYRTRRFAGRNHASSKAAGRLPNRIANKSAHWTPTVHPALLSRPFAGDAGAAYHFAPVLAKLESGAPISMLVLGSSIAGVFGGCTVPAPMLSAGCKCPKCCGTACGHFDDVGWARALFERINSTWPHARHKLYNLGVPAGSLIPSISACPLTYLDFEVDIILFDFLTTPQSLVEQLVRMLLVRSPPPLLLLVEFSVDIVDKLNGRNVTPRCTRHRIRAIRRLTTAQFCPLWTVSCTGQW